MISYTLAGGCFWCLDAAYRVFRGVISVESGYIGGRRPHPTYEQICTGATGHAEAVRVTFDPQLVPSDVILDAFFTMHDPRQVNRQGNDVGTQYRSAMFPTDVAQRVLFTEAMLRATVMWEGPIATTMEEGHEFYPAEDYHQDFFAKNPTQGYCLAVALPKLNKVRSAFASYLRD